MIKKILLILLIPIFCFSQPIFKHININNYKREYPYLKDYQQFGHTYFLIKKERYYEFHFNLEIKQYVFILESEEPFWMTIVEPSGYQYTKSFSDKNKVIRFENIMEKGNYIIKIYSDKDNVIEMIYGEY